MRKCGICGLPGHNARTCPDKKPKGPNAPAKKVKTGGRKCGGCGQSGHDKRNCPNKDGAKPKPPSDSDEIEEFDEDDGDYEETLCDENWKPLKKVKKRKVVTCSVCGDEGHNAASCYYSKPDAEDLGPTIMECGHFSWWKDKDGSCGRCETVNKAKKGGHDGEATTTA